MKKRVFVYKIEAERPHDGPCDDTCWELILEKEHMSIDEAYERARKAANEYGFAARVVLEVVPDDKNFAMRAGP